MNLPIARHLSGLLYSIAHAPERNTDVWTQRNRERIADILKDYMPSGCGFDNGTKLDESSTPERLVFTTSFHHMNAGGYYTRWTDHKVTVKASLVFGLSIIVSGPDHNQIKDVIYQAFESLLNQEVNL